MKVINHPQRSEAWLRWRMGGLSASCASVLLGRNPYKTVWRLWAEKSGRAVEEDLSKNPNVQRGFALEDRARQRCEDLLDRGFLLPVCGASDENPLMLASFDGVTEDQIPAELKCPSEKQYREVLQLGEESEAYKLYYPQVQQQIYVAEAPHGWLMFYSPEDNGEHKLFKVQRDDRLLEEIIYQAEWLWDHVKNDTAPPLDPNRDFFIPNGDDAESWITHATDYRIYDQQIREHEAAIKSLKDKRAGSLKPMQELMGTFLKADFAGVNITKFQKQGSVDLDRLIEQERLQLSADDLDQYRKKPSTQYRVTVTNKPIPKNIIDVDVQNLVADVPEGTVHSAYF